MNIVLLVFLGIIVGMLTILLGGGGGAIYLGILTGIFGLQAANAASTSLVTSLPPLIVGSWIYYRQNKINIKIGNQMLLTAVPAVIIGSLISGYIPDYLYKWIIGLIMIALSLNMLIPRSKKSDTPDTKRNKRIKARFYGILAGLMVGVAGMSGGAVITAGLFLLGLKAFNATATSTYVLVFMSTIGMLFHIAGGSVDWNAGLPLTIGAVFGAVIAPRLAAIIARTRFVRYMSPIIGILLLILGIKSLI